MRRRFISMAVIRRLPRYYRYLNEMLAAGVMQISSRELADRMDLTASQVRQDFNCFGDFGQQGCGYDVAALHKEIKSIIGLDQEYKIVIMGAGRMGCSLLEHFGFERRGFNVLAAFDNNPELFGKSINGVTIHDVKKAEEVCATVRPDIGVLTVPASETKEACAILKKIGVKAIWNFTKGELGVSEEEIVVENVHISDSLMSLCYRLTELEDALYGD
ncbi:MAG TPA: redox-sensing transcriptional repressor Rex [Clostridiales bacterium]|jgi:redox-sensing transcriptional repressor|nr:redox-sensing transcriptional repressor Rex [Clostridiales bacterium]